LGQKEESSSTWSHLANRGTPAIDWDVLGCSPQVLRLLRRSPAHGKNKVGKIIGFGATQADGGGFGSRIVGGSKIPP